MTRSGRRAPLVAACAAWLLSMALAPQAAAAPEAPGATTSERFAHFLARAQRAQGIDAHWALAEAQRLAPQVADGWARLIPVARRITTTSRVPWLRGEAHGTLAAAWYADDLASARAALDNAGLVALGAVLGPLQGSGVDTTPPLFDYDPEATTPGKRDVVRWQLFSDASVSGSLQVGDLIDDASDAHAFLMTSVRAEAPVDAMLVLGSNGPVQLWLDGQPLVSWDGERPLSDWQHAVPVRLARGAHRVVVRVGHRSEPPRLILRVIDRNGLRPAGVTFHAPTKDEALTGFEASRRLPADIQAMAARDPGQRGRVGLYVTPTPPGQRDAARALEEAIARHPDDAELHYLLGRAEESEISRRAAAFERAVALADGRHAEALAELVDIYRREALDAQTDQAARQLAALEPTHPTWLVHDALRVAEHAGAAAAVPILAGDPRLRTAPRLAIAWASLLGQAQRHVEAGEALARAAWLTGGASQLVASALASARSAGDAERAVRWAQRALAYRPYASDLAIAYARALVTAKGPAAAVEALEAALLLHPGSPELHETLGRIHHLAGDQGRALAAFDRALDLAPQNRGLADYRRSLLGDHDLAQRYATPVQEVLDEAADVPPSAEGATYLLERHAVEVHKSGLSSHLWQTVVRIEHERATEPFAQMTFPFTPGESRIELLEAEVIHPDGTRSRPRQVFDHRPAGKQSGVYTLRALRVVRFGALSAGDVVHVQVRTDEIGDRNLFGDFFGTVLPLQSVFPKRRVEVVIDAPAGRELHADGRDVPEPMREVLAAAGRQRLTWDLRDLGAIAVEPQMPGYGDVGAYISVSNFADWQALATWYRDLVRPQLGLSPEMAGHARALVAGAETVRDKVAAIQKWVLRTTRYVGIEFGIHGFKPYRVTEVLERGYGDCKDKASLLVAMLREVGVPADFVLVRTRDLGSLEQTPATLWAFNHAIAYVPQLDTYIDGTSEYAGLGELPELDQGAMVLRIDMYDNAVRPVLTRVPMAPPQDNKVVARSRYELRPDGDASAVFSEVIAGTDAPGLRAQLADRSRRDQLVAEVLASHYPGAVVKAVRYEHLDDLGVPVVIEMDVELPAYATREGDALQVPLTFGGDMLTRYGSMNTRQQPLIINHTAHEVEDIAVHLPAGAKVARMPAPVTLDTPFGRFSLTVDEAPFGFVARSELVLSAAQVAPADYPAFRAFLEEVARAHRARVQVHLPPASTGASDAPSLRGAGG